MAESFGPDRQIELSGKMADRSVPMGFRLPGKGVWEALDDGEEDWADEPG